MSSSVHIDNKKKGILIIGNVPKYGFDDTKLTAGKNILLSLYYNVVNSLHIYERC